MKSNQHSRPARRGYVYVILAAIIWAAAGSAAKFLINNGITPFQLSQLRITLSAISIFLWLVIAAVILLQLKQEFHDKAPNLIRAKAKKDNPR